MAKKDYSSNTINTDVTNFDKRLSSADIGLNKVTVVTNTYIVLETDEIVVCNKTSAFTVTLPTAVVGQVFIIKNINTGLVTVEGDASDTIDGELNQDLYQYEAMQLACYVANKWSIV
jgi:hypothetical protein